jgi:hypothetical protein
MAKSLARLLLVSMGPKKTLRLMRSKIRMVRKRDLKV